MNREDVASAANRAETEAGSEATVDTGVWVPALKEAAWAFLAAAILLAVTYTIFFRSFHPEFMTSIDRDARKLVVPGKDVIPVSVGAVSKKGNQIIIEDFNEDQAVLLLPRAFQAEDYPFIKVNLSGFTRYSKFKIVWRRADDMAQSYALEFNRSGDEVTQLAMVYGDEDYRGRIADIALLFYDSPALGFENNNDVDIVIDSIEFLPFSAARVAEQILEDLTNPPLWSGSSSNYIRGVHPHAVVLPNAVISTWVVVSIALLWIKRAIWHRWRGASSKRTLHAYLVVCLLGWTIGDLLRWNWRLEQVSDASIRYVDKALEEKIRYNDLRCAKYKVYWNDCGSHLLPYF